MTKIIVMMVKTLKTLHSFENGFSYDMMFNHIFDIWFRIVEIALIHLVKYHLYFSVID